MRGRRNILIEYLCDNVSSVMFVGMIYYRGCHTLMSATLRRVHSGGMVPCCTRYMI